jgi:hypothetical protein
VKKLVFISVLAMIAASGICACASLIYADRGKALRSGEEVERICGTRMGAYKRKGYTESVPLE